MDVLAGLTVATVAAMIGFGLTRHPMLPRVEAISWTSPAVIGASPLTARL